MKEIRTDQPQVLTPLCRGIGGDYKTFSASAADLQIQVEMQIQGVKNEVEELNERFRDEVRAKQLWLSHRLDFVEKRVPEVVWYRNGWGDRRPVQVSAATFKSNHLFHCQYIKGELKDVLTSYEALVVGVRVRLSTLLQLRNALSAVTQ